MIYYYQEGKSYKCQPCNVGLEICQEDKDQTPTQVPQPSRPETSQFNKIELIGPAKGLDLQFADESFDEMCDKRVGDYTILARLGSGSMGVVYKAEQIKLQRVVALKMLLPKFSSDENYIKRFLIEARSAAKLNHPNILQIYDVGTFEGRHYFSMEFLQGDSLGGILKRMEKIPLSNALEIVIQISQALIEMYTNKMVHRDIKPDNIMLTAKGISKLADLGLAKSVDYSKELSSLDGSVIMGTPCYIAPEQINNPKEIDHRADIYALGACFYRMVTGVIPFFHPEPLISLRKVLSSNMPPASKVNPSIPDSLSWFIEKMMQKNPQDRFQTPIELCEVLTAMRTQVSQKFESSGSQLIQDKSIKIEIDGPVDTSSLAFLDEQSSHSAPTPASADEELKAQEPVQSPMSEPDAQVGAEAAVSPMELPSQEKGGRTESTAKMPREAKDTAESAGKKKSRPGTASIAEEPQTNSSRSTLMLLSVALVVLLLVGYFAFSGKKKPPAPKPLTPAEKKAKEYETFTKEMNAALQAKDMNSWQRAIERAKSFHNTEPKDFQEEDIQKFQEKLQQNILFYQEGQKFSTLDKEVQNLVNQRKFAEAEEKVDKEPAFSSNAVEKRRENLKQQIIEKAKEHCQNALKESANLEKAEKLPQAIAMLAEAQKGQISGNIEILSGQVKTLQEKLDSLLRQKQMLEHAKKAEFIIENKELVYPLLALKNFVEAKKYCEKKIKDSKTPFVKEINEIREEITALEELDELFWSILGKELKKEKFSFAFKSDSKTKTAKEEVIIGKIISVTFKKRSIVIMTQKNATISRSPDLLTWKCKKEILQMRLENPEKTDYALILLLLIDGDVEQAAKEYTKLPEEFVKKLEDKLMYALVTHIKELTKEQKVSEIGGILEACKKASQKNVTWECFRESLAKGLFDAGNVSKKNASAFYKLVVEYFSDTSYCKEAQAKLDHK